MIVSAAPAHVDAEYVICDGTMRPVTEIGGVPVNVGRAQPIVADRTRRLIEHRDGGCRVPGCASRVVQVHHVTHWENHGPTDTANLCALCPAHHRMHHHGRLGITGNADHPDGLTFSDHRGRPLARARPPSPPNPPPTPPPGTWQHPTGETLSRHDLHFNEAPAA